MLTHVRKRHEEWHKVIAFSYFRRVHKPGAVITVLPSTRTRAWNAIFKARVQSRASEWASASWGQFLSLSGWIWEKWQWLEWKGAVWFSLINRCSSLRTCSWASLLACLLACLFAWLTKQREKQKKTNPNCWLRITPLKSRNSKLCLGVSPHSSATSRAGSGQGVTSYFLDTKDNKHSTVKGFL